MIIGFFACAHVYLLLKKVIKIRLPAEEEEAVMVKWEVCASHRCTPFSFFFIAGSKPVGRVLVICR